MRVSLKRLILLAYVMTLFLLTLRNLKYAGIDFESETSFTSPRKVKPSMEDNNHSAKASIYLDLINFAIVAANKTVRKVFLNHHTGATVRKAHPPILPEDGMETDRILEQLNFKPKVLKSTPVVIYLPQGFGSWFVKPGKDEFLIGNCPVQNCVLTANSDDAETADAVLFRQHIAWPSGKRRNPDQVWIFYILESPENSGNYPASGINWTASFRWDSDLVTPYERFAYHKDVPSDQKDSEPLKPINKSRNYANGKTKKAAWYVSHCVTSNRRELYVRDLAVHFPVDIYGACGPLRCPRFSLKCDELLNKDYKFYLAFENSNCRDYITEKYFVNGLGHDVIPIVMGAQKEAYQRVSPPHSFIHVDDFSGPEDLAAYLHYLNRNDTAYNEYFAWKGSGKLINTKFWCRLCAMLQNPRKKAYQNLQTWWKPQGICTRASWRKAG